MARRRPARHSRPTGRGAMAAACMALELDLARLRTSSFADHLELIRLSTLVSGLLAQVQRLSVELAEMRGELAAERSAATPRDPLVDVLVAQVSELRATVATQQAMLGDLTGRLLDLLERTESAAPAPGVAQDHVDLVTPRPDAAPEQRLDVSTPVTDEEFDDETVMRLRLIRESFGR